MAISLGKSGGDDQLAASINTTPLVDVMLVLLIIFLITIPVATHTVPVALPKQRSQARETQPQNINLSVSADGRVFWNTAVVSNAELHQRLLQAARQEPQPEVHIHGDERALYAPVGEVLTAAQQVGIHKVGFVTEPPPRQ